MTWVALLLLAQARPISISDRVTDRAAVLKSDDAVALRGLFADLERTDSTQVVLLTVPTTDGRPIEQYSLDVARSNAIGRKNLNNGVLIVIAVQDRKCRIEVGTGLEGKLTDALSWHIIRTEMLPRFKEGNYSAGALAGGTAVVRAIRGEYKAPAGRSRDRFNDDRAWVFGVIVFVAALILRFTLGNVLIIFALTLLWPFLGIPIVGTSFAFGSWFLLFILSAVVTGFAMSGSSRYGGWSSSGGGGWSSGGFSGGGGSFSGGGSSGSW